MGGWLDYIENKAKPSLPTELSLPIELGYVLSLAICFLFFKTRFIVIVTFIFDTVF